MNKRLRRHQKIGRKKDLVWKSNPGKFKLEESRCIVTQIARSLLNLISILFVLLLVTACAAKPSVITEFEVVEKIVPVRIPIPEILLQHPDTCFFPRAGKVYVFDWDEWNQCIVDTVVYYHKNLESIKVLQNTKPE